MTELANNSSSSWKETEYPKIKDAIFEKFVDLTQTDMRMSESQKSGFFRAYHDLIAQEPTLAEMDIASPHTLPTLITFQVLLPIQSISTDFDLELCRIKKDLHKR